MLKVRLLVLMIACTCFCAAATPLLAEETSHNSILHGLTNAGTDFWFSLPPGPEGGAEDAIYVEVLSPFATTVRLTVAGRGLEKTLETTPYQRSQISLSPADAQPFNYSATLPPPAQDVWVGAGVNIQADAPIVASVSLRFGNGGESTLLTPTRALNNEYIVGAYTDPGNFYPGLFQPSTLTVCAAENDTKVFVTLGGNSLTRTNTGLREGQTRSFTLQQGDVIAVATTSPEGDVSGTYVRTTKSAAVYAGNRCANVPVNLGECNYIVKGHLPVTSYSSTYHVPALLPRPTNNIVRVFSKNPNTVIFSDDRQFGIIESGKGGSEGLGFVSRRPFDGAQDNFTVWSEDPISVSLFGAGSVQDGEATMQPFALELVPTDQYVNYMLFNPPALGSDPETLNTTYLSLIHVVDANNQISEDIEIARVVNGEFEWVKLRDVSGSDPGRIFSHSRDGLTWAERLLILTNQGGDTEAFMLRSQGYPFCAYISGHIDGRMFAMRAGMQAKDLSLAEDQLPPEVDAEINREEHTYTGTVTDVSDSEVLARIASVWLDPVCSRNMTLEVDEFLADRTKRVNFVLRAIDPRAEAVARMISTDRAGNTSTYSFEFNTDTPGLFATPNPLEFGVSAPLKEKIEQLAIVNYSTEAIQLTALEVDNTAGGFNLINEPALPFSLAAGAELTLDIRWTAGSEPGPLTGNLLVSTDELDRVAIAELRAEVIDGALVISPQEFDFGEIELGTQVSQNIEFENQGNRDVWITAVTESSGTFISDYTGSLLESLPLRLQPGIKTDYTLTFAPELAGQYQLAYQVDFYYEGEDAERRAFVISGSARPTVSSVESRAAREIQQPAILPNPVVKSAQLSFKLQSPQYLSLRIFDTRGIEVWRQPARLYSVGDQNIDLALEALTSGIYHMQILGAETSHSVQFVIER